MQEPRPPEGDETYGGMTAGQLNTVVLGVLGVAVAGIFGWLFLFDGIDMVTGKKDVDQTAFVAQQVANGAILKVSDLPEGWKATVSGDDVDFDFEFSQACKFLEQDTLEIATAESDKLYGPSRQSLSSDAMVFEGEATASTAFGAFANWGTCRDETMNAYRQLILDSLSQDGIDPNTVQVNVTFDPVAAPTLGDATGTMHRLGVALQANDQQVSVTMDILAMQHGRMVGTFVYSQVDAPPSAEEEQKLAQLAAAKLVAAEASLPEA